MKKFKVKTLTEIYNQVLQNKGLKIGRGRTSFRVRDTATLKDFLICRWEQWKLDTDNTPYQMWGLELEEPFNQYYPMDCDDPEYALLSSDCEIQYFQVVGNHLVPEIVRASYMGIDGACGVVVLHV